VLNALLDWPDVGQVFELERVRTVKGQTSVEVVYGITSLGRGSTDAKRLLQLMRAHWGIENQLHYVRDVTLGEDTCRVRKGSSARVLAVLRNAAVYLLERVEAASKAAATRRLAVHPDEALTLLT
jgi:predicted transposase YbfD/YdcC